VETLDDYLAALASDAPTPGGGSAAALVGACGAALVAMVARITSANPAYSERYATAIALLHRGDGLRIQLGHAREEDEAAYAEVVAATALPKTTPEERAARTAALQRAFAGAAEAPLRTAAYASDVVSAAREALTLENPHLVSDVGCAAEFGSAALAAAAYSVRINHRFMKDVALVAAQARELERLESIAAAALFDVRMAVGPR
jgi:formiminotetrahydrofolate cyclodeaminase